MGVIEERKERPAQLIIPLQVAPQGLQFSTQRLPTNACLPNAAKHTLVQNLVRTCGMLN